MADLGNFDATTIEPNAPFELLSPGKYLAQIVASEMRETKDGSGHYLSLEHEILEGAAKGRRIWNNLNLHNPNATTVEFAQRTLSAICHAVGKLRVSNSEELHFLPMLITVRVKPAKDGYDAKNEIKGYEAAAAPQVVAARPTVVRQAAAPAPRAAGATPPWRTKQAS